MDSMEIGASRAPFLVFFEKFRRSNTFDTDRDFDIICTQLFVNESVKEKILLDNFAR